MPRYLTIAAAQSGPIPRTATRAEVVEGLVGRCARAGAGCEIIVYTECALSRLAHWWIEEEAELDAWYEREMPGPATQRCFDEAGPLGIGFSPGYAELAWREGTKHRYNSSVLVGRMARDRQYRKIHLPGHVEHRPAIPFQIWRSATSRSGPGLPGVARVRRRRRDVHLHDRRWAETYRMLALQGAELVLLGYNTPAHFPEYPRSTA